MNVDENRVSHHYHQMHFKEIFFSVAFVERLDRTTLQEIFQDVFAPSHSTIRT